MTRLSAPVGSNLPALKKLNRSAVLDALLQLGPCSRGDLARATGLTASTISSIVGDLLANDLVVEAGPIDEDSTPRTGRPPVLISLHGPGAYAVGVHVGLESIHLAVGDLGGRILAWTKEPMPADPRPENVLPAIRDHVRRMIASSEVPRNRLIGIGVGLVGVVDAGQGIVRSMPQRGWHGVQAVPMLEQWLDLPVVIDNSRRAMTQAELTFGVARQVQNLLFVHCYTTVGCGIAIDRQIYYGDSDASGQLGHVIVVPEGALCVCGHRGCLDTVATDDGIARLAREAVTLEHRGILWDRVAGEVEKINPTLVLEAARAGDPAATRVVERVAGYLGMAIGNLVAVLDPGVVVVAGRIADAGDLFFEPLREEIGRRAQHVLGRTVVVRPSAFGLKGPAIGGLILALTQFVY